MNLHVPVPYVKPRRNTPARAPLSMFLPRFAQLHPPAMLPGIRVVRTILENAGTFPEDLLDHLFVLVQAAVVVGVPAGTVAAILLRVTVPDGDQRRPTSPPRLLPWVARQEQIRNLESF